jgi:peptidoglycan hydrolase-like protein with peptidoglycan-binding domain
MKIYKKLAIVVSVFFVIPHISFSVVFGPNNQSDLFSTNLVDEMINQIDSRIVGFSTSTGNIALYSTRATSTGTWVVNTNNWSRVGSVPLDFSGQSPWNSTGGYNMSGTLISPRHIVFADHYKIANGATVVFIDSNGAVVTRILQNSIPASTTDIRIGILDSDVPSTVAYYPIISYDQLKNYFFRVDDVPVVMLNQRDEVVVHDLEKMIHYCMSNSNNVCSLYQEFLAHKLPQTSSTRSIFSKDMVNGDSGNPVFWVINNQLVLATHHSFTTAGNSYGNYIPEINLAMSTLQGGDNPYQVSTYDLSFFNSYPARSYLELKTLSILEHSVSSSLVGTVLEDLSTADPSYPNFSIISGNTGDVFSISTSTGEIIVSKPEMLDYETSSVFNLVVGWNDWSFPGLVTKNITINLQDFSESVVFSGQTYVFSLNEHSSVGSSLGSVLATSSIAGSPVTYSIISGNTNNDFQISSSTGEITNVSVLDYENISDYHVVVQGVDNWIIPNIATTSVEINISYIPTFSTSDEWLYVRPVYRDWKIQGYTWGENVGWIKISPNASTTAYLGDIGLSGYMYGESTGWISLSCRNTNSCDFVSYGVLNDGVGNLSGFAWGENIGWIHFGSSTSPYKVLVSETGLLSGYAYSESVGYINFNTGDYSATTTWRYPSSRLQCDDGVDNDGDSSVDYPNDSNCSSLTDDSERSPGRRTTNNTIVYSPVVSTTPINSSSPSIQKNIIPNQTQPATPPSVNVPQTSPMKKVFSFTKDLEAGDRGGDIAELQKLLIEKGYSLPAGATGFFGEQTKKALIAFQLDNNIKPVTGYFGPKTRGVILDGVKEIIKPQNNLKFNFTRNLKLNSVGEDVRQLQMYLNNKGFIISEGGVGSKGKETDLYGKKTLDAVKRYQEYYKDEILTPFNLKKGTGLFLEGTRKHVNNN